MGEVKENILQTIGNTPIVRLGKISPADISIYAKIEYYSPGLSIKDRVALRFIERAENEGKIKPGDVILERTSGNMGTGLAVVCAVKGYRFIAVMSEGNSVERRRMLESLGAEVVIVPQAPGGIPGLVSAEDLALVEEKTNELGDKLGAYRPDQFNNPDNAIAHEITTGEEIWNQTDGRIDAFVAYVGSGGTFTGIARALKNHSPAIKCYPVEPVSAQYLAGKEIVSTRHKIQGGGYTFKPPFWDDSLTDGFLAISDDEAIQAARRLAREEGIFTGFSGGANVAGAMKLKNVLKPGSIVVTVLPDSGLKYLSTDLFP
ncbi:MAG: cysteine synthase family protein [Candidatus Thermoplasmatota archaeon]|jgi:cysteine synthase A|nr:cysteine synthase family protein [Candidatus Thermoplasmatota archaeon]MCL6090102.1 cysteine synthase family protein [Candidatus Thermoplasmatota archaeon]MDA8142425.1 cysteine synthase family protein [Thermoplasmatales archaeon]